MSSCASRSRTVSSGSSASPWLFSEPDRCCNDLNGLYLDLSARFCTIVFPFLDCTIGSYVRARAVPFVLSTLAALLYWLIRDSVAGMPLADWAIIVSLAAMGVGVSLLTAAPR